MIQTQNWVILATRSSILISMTDDTHAAVHNVDNLEGRKFTFFIRKIFSLFKYKFITFYIESLFADKHVTRCNQKLEKSAANELIC